MFDPQRSDTNTLLGFIFPHCDFFFFFLFMFLSAAVERAASLPELTPAQRNKLRHLSIISLASNLKVLGHSFHFAGFTETVQMKCNTSHFCSHHITVGVMKQDINDVLTVLLLLLCYFLQKVHVRLTVTFS